MITLQTPPYTVWQFLSVVCYYKAHMPAPYGQTKPVSQLR